MLSILPWFFCLGESPACFERVQKTLLAAAQAEEVNDRSRQTKAALLFRVGGVIDGLRFRRLCDQDCNSV
jgi:hypothetical protein